MPGGWKLVIVDNASTDGTRDVIRQFEASLPVTCCEEPLAGKNRALLRGLREAEGDLFVFSDDDATPDPGGSPRFGEQRMSGSTSTSSLARFVRAGRSSRSAGCSTTWTFRRATRSPIRGARQVRFPPDWFGGRTWPFDSVCSIVATNLIRRSVPRAAIMRWVRKRISPCDWPKRVQMWFYPDAVVHHYIRAYQLDRKWILGRAVRFGRGTYRRKLMRQTETPTLWFGVRRYLYRQIGATALSYSWSTVFRRQQELSRTLGTRPPVGLCHSGPPALPQSDRIRCPLSRSSAQTARAAFCYTFLDEEIHALAAAGVEPYVLSTKATRDADDGPIKIRALPPSKSLMDYAQTAAFALESRAAIPLANSWHARELYRALAIQRFAADRRRGEDRPHP